MVYVIHRLIIASSLLAQYKASSLFEKIIITVSSPKTLPKLSSKLKLSTTEQIEDAIDFSVLITTRFFTDFIEIIASFKTYRYLFDEEVALSGKTYLLLPVSEEFFLIKPSSFISLLIVA